MKEKNGKKKKSRKQKEEKMSIQVKQRKAAAELNN